MGAPAPPQPEADPEFATPERGLLDLTVRLSAREITAGKPFAVFVLVKNPFSRPVWIERVHVSLPSGLLLAHDEDQAAEWAALEKKQADYDRENVAREQKLQDSINTLQRSLDSLRNGQKAEASQPRPC
jgi:hypothetical protein